MLSVTRLLCSTLRPPALLALAVLIGFSAPADAQSSDTNPGRPLTARTIHSGHSLTDPIPDLLRQMVTVSGVRGAVVDRSTIAGSPMEARWEHRPHESMPDAKSEIANYDTLIITERVPLSNTMPWHNSETVTLQWFEHAWSRGNGGDGAETILYASWPEISSGPDWDNPYNDPEGHIPWRERLPLEMARWEQIADYVNANRPEGSPALRVVPGPLIFGAAYDDIQAGRAPGVRSIANFFTDDIHTNDWGTYLISVAHFAVVYGRDPRGLPHRLGQQRPPTPEMADWMQEVVWKVVTEYDRTGIRFGQ